MLNKGTDESSFPDHEWLTLNELCNQKKPPKKLLMVRREVGLCIKCIDDWTTQAAHT